MDGRDMKISFLGANSKNKNAVTMFPNIKGAVELKESFKAALPVPQELAPPTI